MAIFTCYVPTNMSLAPAIPPGVATVTSSSASLIQENIGASYSILMFGQYTYGFSGQLTAGAVTGIDVSNHVLPLYSIRALSIDAVSLLIDPAAYTNAALFSGNDTFNGSSGADFLKAYNGNDILSGGGGDDSLDGGTGADRMNGGTGNDTYYVDNPGDVVVETSMMSTEIDTVVSAISYTLGANTENLLLTHALAINGTGNALDNRITGNMANNILDGGLGNDQLLGAGGNDLLNGGDGNDTLNGGNGDDKLIGGRGIDLMTGGAGNDQYFVHNSGDVVIETSTLLSEIDTVVSTVSYTLGANVENLVLGGRAAISGTGNAQNNKLTGNAANNILNGENGDDVLNGGLGADQMAGGNGNDTYLVDNIHDVIVEASTPASGIDQVISYSHYALSANVENLTLLGTAAISGAGNALDNVLVGNGAANILRGGAGKDTLTGGLGADTFDFNAITDSATAANCDVITDFVSGTDKVDLSNIDAIACACTANDAFAFIGTADFSAAGQVRFFNGVLYGNTDADITTADFQIALTGVTTFAATDVLL